MPFPLKDDSSLISARNNVKSCEGDSLRSTDDRNREEPNETVLEFLFENEPLLLVP